MTKHNEQAIKLQPYHRSQLGFAKSSKDQHRGIISWQDLWKLVCLKTTHSAFSMCVALIQQIEYAIAQDHGFHHNPGVLSSYPYSPGGWEFRSKLRQLLPRAEQRPSNQVDYQAMYMEEDEILDYLRG